MILISDKQMQTIYKKYRSEKDKLLQNPDQRKNFVLDMSYERFLRFYIQAKGRK
ncbi:hypothetical protein [Helicobacter sp. 13S00477-4]|uniref:hypothetical protein n=1 Tax=Helicobacter sp. 13S00477-4 TaxID=1905759 RepID=UPI0015DB8525|nr:hypothetical protein [Helicobacter sp. 13S00477-4]